MIHRCTCPYFQRLRRVCKHILVIIQVRRELRTPPRNIFHFTSKTYIPLAVIQDDKNKLAPPVGQEEQSNNRTDLQQLERQSQGPQHSPHPHLIACAFAEEMKATLRTARVPVPFLLKMKEMLEEIQRFPQLEDTRWHEQRERQDKKRKRN